jgi:hypothetical protein
VHREGFWVFLAFYCSGLVIQRLHDGVCSVKHAEYVRGEGFWVSLAFYCSWSCHSMAASCCLSDLLPMRLAWGKASGFFLHFTVPGLVSRRLHPIVFLTVIFAGYMRVYSNMNSLENYGNITRRIMEVVSCQSFLPLPNISPSSN